MLKFDHCIKVYVELISFYENMNVMNGPMYSINIYINFHVTRTEQQERKGSDCIWHFVSGIFSKRNKIW